MCDCSRINVIPFPDRARDDGRGFQESPGWFNLLDIAFNLESQRRKPKEKPWKFLKVNELAAGDIGEICCVIPRNSLKEFYTKFRTLHFRLDNMKPAA
jgi:hypothetical protein